MEDEIITNASTAQRRKMLGIHASNGNRVFDPSILVAYDCASETARSGIRTVSKPVTSDASEL
jgi:hypothetical protein